MIVNTLIKILFFYFIFVLVRNLLKGASKVNQVKQQMDKMRESMNTGYQNQGHSQNQTQGHSKSSAKEDIVEAEFRHL